MNLSLGLSLSLTNGAAAPNPLADYDLALDFISQDYFNGGTEYTLATMPGYSFSGTGPTIDASGYTAATATTDTLVVGATASSADQVWIMAVDLDVAGTTKGLMRVTGTGVGEDFHVRRHSGNTLDVFGTAGDYFIARAGITTGRLVYAVAYQSGAYRLLCWFGAAHTVDSTGAKAYPAGGADDVSIGYTSLSGGLHADCPIEKLTLKMGTFTDGEIQAMLEAF